MELIPRIREVRLVRLLPSCPGNSRIVGRRRVLGRHCRGFAKVRVVEEDSGQIGVASIQRLPQAPFEAPLIALIDEMFEIHAKRSAWPAILARGHLIYIRSGRCCASTRFEDWRAKRK